MALLRVHMKSTGTLFSAALPFFDNYYACASDSTK